MDFFTLNVTDALVNSVCGLMSLSLWLNQRREKCLVYWGSGLVIYALVAAAYPFQPGNAIVTAIGYSLLEVAVVVIWLGFRSFDEDGPAPVWLLAMPLVPLASCLVVGFLSNNWVVANYVTLIAHCAIAIAQAVYIFQGRIGRFGPRAMAAYSVFAVAIIAVAAGILRDWLGDVGTADSLIPLCDHALTIIFTMSVIAMVGERDFLRLLQVARHDPLTGALNRAGLAEAIANHRRHSALLLFDLDNFKSINDTFGHDGGDAVLRHFTRQATESIGDAGLLARLGGEEFLIVSEDACLDQGKRLAQAICLAAKTEPVHVGQVEIPFTVSVGVALRHSDEDLYQALRRADEALYRAKAEGRDRVVTYADDRCLHSSSSSELRKPRREVRG